MDTAESINEKLLLYYGRNVNCDMPNFRVIWSTGVTEKRFGEFEVSTESGIFLRTEVGVREALKYPFDQDRWILERLFPNPHQDEVVGDYTYEPIWVFKDKNGNYLELREWAVDALMKQLFTPQERRTEKDAIRDEVARLEKEKKYTKERMADESPYIASKLDAKEAIVVPGGSNVRKS